MYKARKKISIWVVAAALVGGAIGAWQASPATASTSKQSSYVRVCRDARGIPDRRACRANDPKRTQLAFNLPE